MKVWSPIIPIYVHVGKATYYATIICQALNSPAVSVVPVLQLAPSPLSAVTHLSQSPAVR